MWSQMVGFAVFGDVYAQTYWLWNLKTSVSGNLVNHS